MPGKRVTDLIRHQVPYPSLELGANPLVVLLEEREESIASMEEVLFVEDTGGEVEEDFVFTINTALNDTGITGADPRQLGVLLSHPVGSSATIDWGDGTVETFDALVDDWWTNDLYHTYAEEGEFTVRVSGDVSTFSLGYNYAGAEMVTSCSSFGVFPNWRQDGNIGANYPAVLAGCINLTSAPETLPVHMNSVEGMFSGCDIFNGPEVTSWDTSHIISMEDMFGFAISFNQDIGGWDVSSVTNMETMFSGASSFNQDLSGWCVSGIAEEPLNFATDAVAWVLPKPVWGTCP